MNVGDLGTEEPVIGICGMPGTVKLPGGAVTKGGDGRLKEPGGGTGGKGCLLGGMALGSSGGGGGFGGVGVGGGGATY